MAFHSCYMFVFYDTEVKQTRLTLNSPSRYVRATNFSTSSMRMTGKESFSTIIHCSVFRWVSLKIICGRSNCPRYRCWILSRALLQFQRDSQAGGPRRWSWSEGTWKGSWHPPASSYSTEACAAETGSQTSWRRIGWPRWRDMLMEAKNGVNVLKENVWKWRMVWAPLVLY